MGTAGSVTTYDKLLSRVMNGQSDANLDFDDLRRLPMHLGFAERVHGSHHVFVSPGIPEMINLQREGRLAKPYQVRQVRTVITAHHLAAERRVDA
jgi:hypothetical protein